ncbi:short-chain dehydrogenase [Pleomassaria siparia CBS 279.74]|uniref:Short-chain dehydrogenase n=1 Tax=Pleomassaria siparia CBS 279.74 TaxID=1314801 RepID=A0A6G1KE74_9PLEO|nr:short-chain dehydrogenase [Pleomassaria siparia CBS 279.74]
MAGSIVITGANGSAAVYIVRYLLEHHPDKHLVLTVRDTSDSDVNTSLLRNAVIEYSGANAKVTIRALDLSSLASVTEFTKTLAADIVSGELPLLESIVCNAYYWNLTKEMETTSDGYEKTFQINHIAHAALVLRLLGSFSPGGGRVVLFTSDAHWPGKNSLEKIPPTIPSDLDLLAMPPLEKDGNHMAEGFNRYAVSKLVILMWMYALNEHVQKDSKFANITAVAINPGNLSDSRALRVNTPKMLQIMSKFVIQPMRPLLRLADPTMRTSREAGIDVAKLATSEESPGVRGFFTLLKKDTSSPDSLDSVVQEAIWKKTLEWTGISKENKDIPA